MKHLLMAAMVLAPLFATPLLAAPTAYALQPEKSQVGFTWDFGKDAFTGKMPVASASLSIDFDRLANSQIDVAVDVTGARAGFAFATQALKSPKVLNARKHPQIRFVSRKVRPNGAGALIDGDLTVRGVTRPATFDAQLYRQRGTQAGDRDNLSIVLTGALSRSEFGADGYADLVGDQVRLQILARIQRVDG